jgi:hypothetical protein
MAFPANCIPQTMEERLERLEALEQIRQLAYRYALAVDTRNLDDLVALFVDDVRVGRGKRGRGELKAWFAESLTRFGDSIHFVGNHVIDLDSVDEAHGVVTCRDELEIGTEWRVGFVQYWDKYSRRDGRWYFNRRSLHRWYMVDVLARPRHGAGLETDRESLQVGQLPDAWPSWATFWEQRGRSPRDSS